MHIARGKDIRHIRPILAGRSLYVRPLIDLDTERIRHILLAAQESRRDQDDLCRQNLLTAGDFFHIHAAGRLILFPGQFHDLHRLKLSILVLDEFLHGGLIDPRIMTEQCDRFLLTVIRLTDLRPFRPRIVLRSCIGCLGHHLDLRHGFAAVADGGSHAVISRIPAADDHDILIFRVDIFLILETGIQQALCVCLEEIHREIDPFRISSRRADVSRI